MVKPESAFSGTFSSSLLQVDLEMEGRWQLCRPFPVCVGSSIHVVILNINRDPETTIRHSYERLSAKASILHKPLDVKKPRVGL